MSERKMFRKNNFRQLSSHPFWNLNRKNSEYTGKFRLLIKTKVYVSGRKFTEQSFWEKLLKISRVSGWIMKLLRQWRNFFIRVAKTEKLCPEEQIKENTFSKEKSLLFFFQDPVSLSFNSSGNVRQKCRKTNLRSLGRLWGKIFETLHNISTLAKVSNLFGLFCQN